MGLVLKRDSASRLGAAVTARRRRGSADERRGCSHGGNAVIWVRFGCFGQWRMLDTGREKRRRVRGGRCLARGIEGAGSLGEAWVKPSRWWSWQFGSEGCGSLGFLQ
ncbi:uncharacterized protein A4U43_C07F28720 [Asparagus officinalis]|uniref:Uncharacterized protein n=1 Tax=Asparagus officinalis TaxID=4686 RepID=A0A5P1EKV6_ASPOF|nr:uncharacterized protein A4U43_C07F28720 [Asparagus officinalis]